MAKVIVEKPAPLTDGSEREVVAGVIGVNPNKPEFGNLQLREVSYQITGGFMNQVNKVHFMAGRVEHLEGLVKSANITANSDLNAKLQAIGQPAVTIKVVESTTPFYPDQEPKINPTSGEIMTHNGEPIFRNTELVNVDQYAGDELLKMDSQMQAQTTTMRVGTTNVEDNPLER